MIHDVLHSEVKALQKVSASSKFEQIPLACFVRLERPFPQGMGQLVAGEASSCLTQEKLTVRERQGVPFAIKDLVD